MAKGDYTKVNNRHIDAYKKVVAFLVKFYGSINKAVSAAGISDHAYYRLVNDDELVSCVAKKIIDCYWKTKKESA